MAVLPDQIPVKTRSRLGRVLCELGLITEEELSSLLEEQRTDGRRLGELLVERKKLTSEQVAQGLAHRLGVEFLPLNPPPDASLVGLMTPAIAHRYTAIPVRRASNGRLMVAMADPTDLPAIDDLRMLLGEPFDVGLALPEAIVRRIPKDDEVQAIVADLEVDPQDRSDDGAHDVGVSDGEAPVIRFVNSLIARAVSERASDIHIEPQKQGLVVRMRIDGLLRAVTQVPASRGSAIVSRLKVIADLDIAERRVPQDGRVAVKLADRALDLRIATLPTVGGESVVIRLLDQTTAPLTLDDLGFSAITRKRFEAAYTSMHGLVLVTGPTGSGKTSTMYATLQQLNGDERKILTVEDPVEFRIAGINQVQVRPKAGLTFAAGLRSMLRCDPDVIMIGEVRDEETARIAVEAALTGHLVLATLHTNDAASAIVRLIDMGIEPFLLASALRGVLAQRLVRSLCHECREPFADGATALSQLAERHSLTIAGPPAEIYRAVGCDLCHGVGYHGRFCVAETLLMSPTLEHMVLSQSAPSDIARQARAEGMRSMLDEGLRTVVAGDTTVDELTRVVH